MSPPPQGVNLHSCSHGACRLATISRASRLYRSLLYAVIVFISFFLMLVFMTYNVRSDARANCGVRQPTMRFIFYRRI